MMKRIAILTGGGDVPPLNTVIASAIKMANNLGIELVGCFNGWQGLLDENFINLNYLNINPSLGGTILRSSRINLKNVVNAEARIESVCHKNNIEGVIVIGGEDTLSNSLLLQNVPQVLISKTIDNDVGIIDGDKILNYFTLGYPTAAEKISSLVSMNEGLRTTAYSHERIIVVESMGMHAGWLALASSFGHPDYIIIPEFKLNYGLLLEKVIEKYKTEKNVIIVVAEGANWADGKHISANEDEKDSFGHPKFKGAAEILTNKLKEDLKKYFDTRNINSINPSYYYRSGKPNMLDMNVSSKLGKKAIEILSGDFKQQVLLTLENDESDFKVREFMIRGIADIENVHRFIDSRFYNETEFSITLEGKKYLSKIIEELPLIDYKIDK